MHKKELIHVHNLLLEVREKIQNEVGVSDDQFKQYDKLDISPVGIHKNKEAQEKAVFALAECLSNVIQSIEDEELEDIEKMGSVPVEENIKKAENLDNK